MKNLFVLLMAFSFFVVSCNNNKNDKNQNLNNRDKDDYGKSENLNTDNADKTNVNTGNTGWAENDKNRFLKGCIASFDENQSELANKICPCVLEKMEKEFASYSEADTKEGETASTRIALQCKDEIVGNSDNNNTVSNWSRSDENQWMKACTTPLIESLGEEKATNYCSCVLDKMKEMYSSFEEANRKGTTETGTELGKKCVKELGIGQ
jgi:hypothetical protein